MKVIQFSFDEDRERAIDLLDEAGETYGGVAPECIFVKDSAAEMLQREGIRFQIWGEQPDTGATPSAGERERF